MIFLKNIYYWLSNNKKNEALKLINKFIENNSNDREIYLLQDNTKI